MAKPYAPIFSTDIEFIGRYKTGLTGETGVFLTPGIISEIQENADWEIDGYLHRHFDNDTPPIIRKIAQFLCQSETISRASQGRLSHPDDPQQPFWLRAQAYDLMDKIKSGDLIPYDTSGNANTVTDVKAQWSEVGSVDESRLFDLTKEPQDWKERTQVYKSE